MDEARLRWFASLGASALAETISLPTDVVKTRLQLSGAKVSAMTMARNTARAEGLGALWKGLSPALLRQCGYHPFAIVMYTPVRDFMSQLIDGSNATSHSFATRLWAGGVSGGIAIAVFNWSDVIKVQMQSSKSKESIAGVVKRVYASDGLRGFSAGVQPNVVRTFVVNAAELGSYDQIKTTIMIPALGDNPLAHIGASSAAGVISASCSTPIDVVKTRLMNQSGRENASSREGMLRLGWRIAREEGFRAMYAGFVPICVRKVIWCTVFFVAYEQSLILLK